MRYRFLTGVFLLVAGHFLADFPLQDDHMAKTKNRNRSVDMSMVPPGQEVVPIWPFSLIAHGFIHGLVVYVITRNIGLAILETIMHAWIDFEKCDNNLTIYQDQSLHIAFKIIYALV